MTFPDVEVLCAITMEQPRASLDEVTRELQRRTGAAVCSATVRKALGRCRHLRGHARSLAPAVARPHRARSRAHHDHHRPASTRIVYRWIH